jgi:energy-converting hydrogenase Eha subunit E
MLSYDEALALFTFGAISVLSTYIYVRVMQKKEWGVGI